MCYTGLFKRIIPFALTFALGLFIASFFVSIAFPGQAWRESRRVRRFQELQQLRIENDQLREERRILKLQNEELRRKTSNWDADAVLPDELSPVDEMTFHEHHPPKPPKRPKHPRFE